MGGQQSTPAVRSAHEKAVMERLKNLRMEEEDDYIEISGAQEKQAHISQPLLCQSGALPVSVLEAWQSAVLKDPKNRYARPTSFLYVKRNTDDNYSDLLSRPLTQIIPRKPSCTPQRPSQPLRSSTSLYRMRALLSRTSTAPGAAGSSPPRTSSASP